MGPCSSDRVSVHHIHRRQWDPVVVEGYQFIIYIGIVVLKDSLQACAVILFICF